MIKNNFELDIKMKCLESGLTQAQLGERIGTSEQYINRVIKQTKRVACGFRNMDNYERRIMVHIALTRTRPEAAA